MADIDNIAKVSVHGGHCGEFCCHARDSLDAIIQAYADCGFAWVGITEHMPPVDDRFVYPDEIAAGLDAAAMYKRFRCYIDRCRQLQRSFASKIRVFVAFETETCSGSDDFIRKLIAEFQPDYVVGSAHHVDDIPIDSTAEQYRQAIDRFGGLEALYCRYFDQQLDMIEALKPAVVGHFDLIRIFDSDYPRTMQQRAVQERIGRNLDRIGELNLIMDFNLRALAKGADEPYISRPIMEQAIDRGIAVVPGDDSHGVENVGMNLETGIRILREAGAATNWRTPAVNIQ